jgi:hypothetical protein
MMGWSLQQLSEALFFSPYNYLAARIPIPKPKAQSAAEPQSSEPLDVCEEGVDATIIFVRM